MKILLLIDHNESTITFTEQLKSNNRRVDIAHEHAVAKRLWSEKSYDVVIVKKQFGQKTTSTLIREFSKIKKHHTNWVLIVSGISHNQKVTELKKGVTFFLQNPLVENDLVALMKNIEDVLKHPLHKVACIVQQISGIKLNSQKKQMINTRIMRRCRDLKLHSIDQYLDYFDEHRESEVHKVVSVLTTHTTNFFREEDHFNYLFESVFPQLVKNGDIRIWSAACSTGEEVYSLAISFIEYCRENSINMYELKRIKFIGSDVDHASIETAKNGIYLRDDIKKLSQQLQSTYFDIGQDELSDYCKVKDYVKDLCSFTDNNLMSETYKITEKCNVILIRNTFIYFNKDNIEKICRSIKNLLTPGGHFFLGHSESIREFNTPFSQVGNSIYQIKNYVDKVHSNRLHGASSKENGKNKIKKSMEKEKIKVLIVDDSPTIRRVLKDMINNELNLQVVGEVVDPILAKEFISKNHVDVVTLDVHMPRMDGITYLEQCKADHPPVVMISTVDKKEIDKIFKLNNGVLFEFIQKPNALELDIVSKKITETIAAAFFANRMSCNNDIGKIITYNSNEMHKDFILIGASTGGVQAIEVILRTLPTNCPPVVIVQHIPTVFSKAFAKRLNEICLVNVQEASDRMIVSTGNVYIAPGGRQMAIKKTKKTVVIRITDDEKVNSFRPSVDYLFHSALKLTHDYNITAILLTGMGKDGAKGLKELREQGSYTIAQDEESSVVFGMPAEAIKLGGADAICSIGKISEIIFCSKTSNKKKVV